MVRRLNGVCAPSLATKFHGKSKDITRMTRLGDYILHQSCEDSDVYMQGTVSQRGGCARCNWDARGFTGAVISVASRAVPCPRRRTQEHLG